MAARGRAGCGLKRRGFLLGKFLPPQEGHRFLVESALAMTDETTVLVCSTSAEPIPGALRYKWMRDMAPRARVLHLDRDLPQKPEDHPNFWPTWRAAIMSLLGEPPTHVFASEPYVFRLAQELGARPVLVDPAREAVPINGSAILAAPHRHWPFIPQEVRPLLPKTPDGARP